MSNNYYRCFYVSDLVHAQQIIIRAYLSQIHLLNDEYAIVIRVSRGHPIDMAVMTHNLDAAAGYYKEAAELAQRMILNDNRVWHALAGQGFQQMVWDARIDQAVHLQAYNSGIGAWKYGGLSTLAINETEARFRIIAKAADIRAEHLISELLDGALLTQLPDLEEWQLMRAEQIEEEII